MVVIEKKYKKARRNSGGINIFVQKSISKGIKNHIPTFFGSKWIVHFSN
jgi:hypothetical protein